MLLERVECWTYVELDGKIYQVTDRTREMTGKPIGYYQQSIRRVTNGKLTTCVYVDSEIDVNPVKMTGYNGSLKVENSENQGLTTVTVDDQSLLQTESQNMPQETQVSRMVDGYRLDGLKVADTTGINGFVVIVSIFNAYGTLLDQFEADALMLLELHFAFDYRLTADVERQLSEFWTACVK